MLAAGQLCPASKVENVHLKRLWNSHNNGQVNTVPDATAGQSAQSLVSWLGRWLIYMSDRDRRTRLIRPVF